MGFDLTTFFFELVNFGLLLWVLQRVLYRPLREGIERRRAELSSERERSIAERRDALTLRDEAEQRLAEIEKLRETVIADAREQAAKEEARILDQAREDAGAELERVELTLERERSEALVWMREATVDNAIEIAGGLLNDLLPEAANAVLLDALVHSLTDSASEGGKSGVLKPFSGATDDRRISVQLSMPGPPPETELRALRSALDEALEMPWDLVIREDPSLVAGPVLRVGDQVLDASLSGHLAALRERARALAMEVTP